MGNTRLDVDVVRTRGVRTELRAEVSADAPLGTLVGEFSVFGVWYEIDSYWEGHFIERILPGAFKRTIKNRSGQTPVRCLLEHGFDPTVGDKPLGVPAVLEEREAGPYAETPLLDTSYNRDLAPALAAGAYGQSFRFRVVADQWAEPEAAGFEPDVPDEWKALPQRSVTEVALAEFGPTVWPASPTTNETTGLRSGTDTFYEQLKRRDPSAYEQAHRSVRAATGGAAAGPESEDPPREHAPSPVRPQERADHLDAPPAPHSAAPATPTTPQTPQEAVMSAPLTMEERAARITEIDARLSEIDTENAGAELRSDHQSEWDGLEAERAEHHKAIAAQEARTRTLANFAARPGAGESPESVERSAADRVRAAGPAVHIKPDDIYDLSAIRNKARSLDDVPRLMRDNALRAIDQARFSGVRREAAQTQVRHLLDVVDDDQGTVARRILVTGSPVYERAFGKAMVAGNTLGLTSEEQRALSLGVDGAGGYAVPFQLDPTVILTSDGVDDPIRQLARVEQITGKVWEGVSSAGVSVTRSAEAAEAAETSPTFTQPTVATSRVTGWIPFSVELETSWSALRAELTNILADAKAQEEATAFLTGNGTAPNPQGILVGATTASVTAAAGAITYTDLTGAKNAVPSRWRRNASWLSTPEFYDLARTLTPAEGDVWAPLAESAAGRPLLGKPTFEASEMPAFSLAAGTKVAVVGDFRQFLIVDRIGMTLELVPQVFGANQRPTGQRGVFAFWHNGSKVLVPAAFRVLTMHA